MKIICRHRREKSRELAPQARGIGAISSEVDNLLHSKGINELNTLESQIRKKLESNEPIDVEYWEHLLHALVVWKARARLRDISNVVLHKRLENLQNQDSMEAEVMRHKLESIINKSKPLVSDEGKQDFGPTNAKERAYPPFLSHKPENPSVSKEKDSTNPTLSRFTKIGADDFSQATTALYEREVARGVNDNEEIFVGEEEVTTMNKPQWADKFRPRKPRYFNRVQMGYEWNKYNQTHYDHDNPPPKVVQGYKFNIFYPDLIDKTRAPTYRIERENGRKKGQSFAPAGEEDTCLIRFMAGPPYEDIAFRIVDKEWDYSAKRERGFRSSFDKVSKRHDVLNDVG